MRTVFAGYSAVSRLTLAAGLLAVSLMAEAPGSPAASTGSTGSAVSTGSTGSTGASGGPGAPAAPPQILSLTPAAPLAGPNRPLTLQGTGFQDKLTVTFSDAEGDVPEAARVEKVATDHVEVAVTLATPGKWKVVAANPGGAPSAAYEFAVAKAPSVALDSPSVWAFGLATLIVTVFLIILFTYMLHDLHKSQKANQWSFGDALSEESEFQPKEIRQRSDLIMLASSSRLIALLGLLGILTTVLGIGYAVMWNLFVYGTVPDLSEVRSFLYGSACLFAPYLANKLAGVFPSSSKPQGDGTAGTATSMALSGVSPLTLRANSASQQVQITGSGFRSGLVLTFTDPELKPQVVSGTTDIPSVEPTLLTANVRLDTPGSWKVAATNPSGVPSKAFPFSVAGPPTIDRTDPATPTHKAEAQDITFVGKGFVSGLKVTLTAPGGVVNEASVTLFTPTRVKVSTTLAKEGDWQAVITNPGPGANDSNLYKLTVG